MEEEFDTNNNEELPEIVVRSNDISKIYVAIISNPNGTYTMTNCTICLGLGKSGGCECGTDSDPD